AYNFLIARDGTLIAHPGDLKDEQKWQGQLSLEKIDNPDIVRMYRDITAGAEPDAEVTVIDDPDGGNSLLAAFLPGPDWWLVLVYPEELISREAHHAARIVLVLGFSLFVLYYIVVSYVIARQVRSPLGRLQEAIALVTDGRYNEVSQSPDKLPLDQKNEIGQLAAAFLNMARVVFSVNTNLQQIVENRTRELEDANAKLRALSLLDGLTGIHNRRSFDRDLAGVFEQAKQGVETFSLLLCDVDLFKAYNDLYGHTEGDEVLRRIAGVIDANIREGDRVYRYGGEELAVLFNHADGNVAAAIGERILDAVRALGIPHQDGGHGVVTISGGLVEFSPDFQNPTDMVKAADDGLYRAKSSGRNRLETAPGPEQEGTRG
ncbi:MAG: diguanylate cyclase, partial [Desulfovibrionaceae bacterium]